MPKASKPGYYAVRRGRVPGIYLSWADCEAQVKGYTGALYKKLSTKAEAIEFMAPAAPTSGPHDIVPTASTDPSSVRLENEKDCDIVYCDGACKGNGQSGSVAGVGVWWGHGDPRNLSERCPGDQTNNRAELIAIVRILETTPRLNRRLVIKTDSNYSIQCVTLWIFNWMKNGFLAADGKPVKNRTLIKYLAALLHVRRKSRQTIEFKHVRGHVGIEGNEAADQLANLGATKPVVPERDWENLEKQVLQTDVSSPEREPRRHHLESEKDVTRRNATVVASRPSDGVAAVHRPTTGTVAAQGQRPAPSAISEELEVYASCLLGDDEWSTLGKDGVFDSDF